MAGAVGSVSILLKVFCLDNTKMVLNTTLVFDFSTFKLNIKIYLKYHISVKKCSLTEKISCVLELK